MVHLFTRHRPGTQSRGEDTRRRILETAVRQKPTGHHLLEGRSTRERSMFQIGG